MPEKLTPEFCRNNDIIFHPKNRAEARSLQRALFEMGFAWGSGVQSVQCLDECVGNGLVLQKGSIYYRGADDNTPYVHCAIERLDENYVSPERKFLMEQFDKINARLDELEKMVREVRNEVLPHEVDKPVPTGLTKKGGNSP